MSEERAAMASRFDPPFDDMGFIDAHLVGEVVRSQVRFAYWGTRRCDDLVDPSGGVYLYIGSACAEVTDAPGHPLIRPAYEHWLADCAAMRARVKANPVEEIEVPARKMSWNDFTEDTVRLALYRLTEASVCDLGPRSDFHPRDTGSP